MQRINIKQRLSAIVMCAYLLCVGGAEVLHQREHICHSQTETLIDGISSAHNASESCIVCLFGALHNLAEEPNETRQSIYFYETEHRLGFTQSDYISAQLIHSASRAPPVTKA